ncbi:hypothetical protein A3H81_01735 [Candidatus Daviesbacteria bacterium RIFCSPLOWO2_02_FULL_38_18]|nr:MAG: hypothetical protein A3D02_01810 [Candidatus Daviesbacteria bacterium RIFCSPHIGHO2_02_FULL_39_41]OGE45126.1 MAG: hypothetical protein A3E67_04215 [Candidatus Daviesbacteria bacterium RIFCSPHIGHO2_12_FULL_38_25]OGE68537.1 MAG: hypothetical protein A3H81_01735 [Candidatus Daviesbacteria bacterium RIFCSPLOWO2_02_FULL_38_18]
MTEPEPSPQSERPSRAAIYERLFGKRWDDLPIFDPRNIPALMGLMALDGPQIWLPFSKAVKNNRGYDYRIDLPPHPDKLVLLVVLNHVAETPGEVPPINHIKHLLREDEELGEAAKKILAWWNPNATIGVEPVEVVAVKSITGEPRALIYYHKGLRMPEERRVLNLIPSLYLTQNKQVKFGRYISVP